MVERKGGKDNKQPSSLNKEENKTTQDDSDSEEELHIKQTPQSDSKHPFPKPILKDQLYAYSRWLHRKTPPNRYHREKIPYKTILVAFLFLILGVFLMYLGLEEYKAGDTNAALERWCLGTILFIPGSYHSVLAV